MDKLPSEKMLAYRARRAAESHRRALVKVTERIARAEQWRADQAAAEVKRRELVDRLVPRSARVVKRWRRAQEILAARAQAEAPPKPPKRLTPAAVARALAKLADASPALRDAILRLHDGAAVERMAAMAEREADPGPPDSQLQFLTPGARGRWAMRHALNAERARND